MTPELVALLVGQFVRVGLKVAPSWEDTSSPFCAGWCKMVCAEGLLLVADGEAEVGDEPTFVPWDNVALVQVGTAERPERQAAVATEKFLAAEVRT